ncbi:hypothetical protein M0813_29294 [Anaeramoeba flamelloides]|uniref:RING-type domain-containing protein n=1 Tax=Anaeramoeba flamelloides TaxID=1746091 RepID=A0ABQ8XQ04_9EUKA|nr:hypothetical protein M0813_29294 [Anaeramoeba flamelloides]
MSILTDKLKKKQLRRLLRHSRKYLYSPTYEIYSEIRYDQPYIKELIQTKKLSPLFHPQSLKSDIVSCECNICFNFFPILNQTTCCSKQICSECFLQIQPKAKTTTTNMCPFCRSPGFSVSFSLRSGLKKITHLNNTKINKEKLQLSRESERNEFQKTNEETRKKLLKIRHEEEKNGLYEQERNEDLRKEKIRKREKEMFLLQKKKQEQIQRKLDKTREKERQIKRERERERLRILEKQRQIQREKLLEREREKEKERERENENENEKGVIDEKIKNLTFNSNMINAIMNEPTLLNEIVKKIHQLPDQNHKIDVSSLQKIILQTMQKNYSSEMLNK